MEPGVFFAVLASGAMLAAWNVLVKLQLDRFLSLLLIQSLIGLCGIAMLFAFPAPAAASIPYACASGMLNMGYVLFLVRSYRAGDVNQVYPIARGAAPLLVLLATRSFMHGDVSLTAGLCVVLLAAGIWTVSLAGRREPRLDRYTLLFALGTAVFIAGYTIVDGLGGRISGQPSSYAGMVFVFNALFVVAAALVTRGPGVFRQVAPHWKTGVIGAILSGGSYWIAIWAMTRAPIASVAALRETSILMVILLSVQVLREPVGLPRLAGGLLIVSGAALIKLS